MNAGDFSAVELRNTGVKPKERVTITDGFIHREYEIEAGSFLVSHSHPYDHMSVLLSGEVLLRSNGRVQTLRAPYMVTIKANIVHGIYAVTDCIWDCVHSLEMARASAAKGDQHVMDGVE